MTCTKSHVRTERKKITEILLLGDFSPWWFLRLWKSQHVFTKWYTFRDRTSFQAGNRMKQDLPHNYPFILAESLHLFLLKQLFNPGGVGAGEITARRGGVGGLPGIQ